jgi:hypothetical protein
MITTAQEAAASAVRVFAGARGVCAGRVTPLGP